MQTTLMMDLCALRCQLEDNAHLFKNGYADFCFTLGIGNEIQKRFSFSKLLVQGRLMIDKYVLFLYLYNEIYLKTAYGFTLDMVNIFEVSPKLVASL